jgi:sirohydrochlorin cobaltochelatase
VEIALPTLAQGFERCAARGAREIVVCPYFLAPGRHSRDIARLVAEIRAAYPDLEVAVAEPLGFDERLVDLVLDRADAAIRQRPPSSRRS